MNRAYRLIWNAAKDVWVVAAEKVKGKGRCPAGAVRAPSLSIGLRSNSDNYPGGETPEPKLSSLRTTDRSMPFSSLMMALEPRFMFDAAAAATVGTLVDSHHTDTTADKSVDLAKHHQDWFAGTSDRGLDANRDNDVMNALAHHRVPGVGAEREQDQPSTSVLFVDSRVQDVQTLLAGVKPGIEVVFLDPQKDGVDQISSYLQSHTHVSAMYIVSHGASGEVVLGTTTLDAATLTERSAEIGGWSASLTAHADILLYGCDVAAGSQGAAFIGRLAQTTGTDVAASTDLTGGTAVGGNWVLERQTGLIEAGLFASDVQLANYDATLAATAINAVTADDVVVASERSSVTITGTTNSASGSVIRVTVRDSADHLVSVNSTALGSANASFTATIDLSTLNDGPLTVYAKSFTSAALATAAQDLTSGDVTRTTTILAANSTTILPVTADNVVIAGERSSVAITGTTPHTSGYVRVTVLDAAGHSVSATSGAVTSLVPYSAMLDLSTLSDGSLTVYTKWYAADPGAITLTSGDADASRTSATLAAVTAINAVATDDIVNISERSSVTISGTTTTNGGGYERVTIRDAGGHTVSGTSTQLGTGSSNAYSVTLDLSTLSDGGLTVYSKYFSDTTSANITLTSGDATRTTATLAANTTVYNDNWQTLNFDGTTISPIVKGTGTLGTNNNLNRSNRALVFSV